MIPPPSPINPSGQIDGRTLRHLGDRVRDRDRIGGPGLLFLDSSLGVQIQAMSMPEGFYAVTQTPSLSGSNAGSYGAKRVERLDDHTFSIIPDTPLFIAWEANHRTSVVVPTVIWVQLEPATGDYIFFSEGGPTGTYQFLTRETCQNGTLTVWARNVSFTVGRVVAISDEFVVL